MLDKKHMKVDVHVERKLAAGTSDIAEGAVLCEVIEAGEAKVTVVATPDGSEKVAGFAILPYSLPTQAVAAEKLAPTADALLFSLRNNNLVADSVRIAVDGGSDMTADTSNFAGAASAGSPKVDLVGGRIKFHADDAGKKITVIYRHELTVAQARMRFHERSINNRDLVGSLQLVGVAKGYVELCTDQYDTSKDYSSGDALKVGADGKITNDGSGAEIPGGKVLALPDASGTVQGPFLKISALIP